jgi:predicted phosphodiesterase
VEIRDFRIPAFFLWVSITTAMPIHLPPIDRRRFLAGALSAGALALLPRQAWAEESPHDPNCFALLSDIHIPEQRDHETKGVKPVHNLEHALDVILKEAKRPSQIIVSGDCAHLKGHAGDYAMIRRLIEPVRHAGMHVHLALGNHDHRKVLREAFPELSAKAVENSELANKFVSIVETQHANWFLLDSLDQTDVTPGILGEGQLKWLAQELDARPNKPALLVAHHQLSKKLPTHGLVDSEAFFNVILPRKQVKAYFYGHTHQWHCHHEDNMHLVNIPTTAWLFEESQPRGFVLSHLRADGMTLVLHSIDHNHPKHGEKVELKWRA